MMSTNRYNPVLKVTMTHEAALAHARAVLKAAEEHHGVDPVQLQSFPLTAAKGWLWGGSGTSPSKRGK